MRHLIRHATAARPSVQTEVSSDVLKKRTLYNERPTWLAMLHADLDRTVWDAYGWEDAEPSEPPDDVILGRLLDLNSQRRLD